MYNVRVSGRTYEVYFDKQGPFASVTEAAEHTVCVAARGNFPPYYLEDIVTVRGKPYQVTRMYLMRGNWFYELFSPDGDLTNVSVEAMKEYICIS